MWSHDEDLRVTTGEVTEDEHKVLWNKGKSDKDKNDIEKECSHSENWNGMICWKETGILKVNIKGRNSDGSQILCKHLAFLHKKTIV